MGRKNRLPNMEITQPCLFIINTLHYLKCRASARKAEYLIGHSLGEYNAVCELRMGSMRKADRESNKAIDRRSRAG